MARCSRACAIGWLLIAACGESSPQPSLDDAGSARHDAAPDDCTPGTAGCTRPDTRVECSGSRLRVLRVAGWPGGGVQLALQLRDAGGSPLAVSEDAEPALTLAREGDDAMYLRAAPAGETTGVTAIVIAPSDEPAEHAARIAAARALIEALPPGERIGIWLGAGALPMVAELTERRDHALARLDALAPQAGDSLDDAAFTELERRIAQVRGPFGPLGRNLVAVGPLDAAVDEAQPPLAGAGLTLVTRLRLAAAEDDDGGLAPAADAARWDERTDPERAGALLAEHVAALRAATLRLGACGPFERDEPLVLESEGERCTLRAPPPPGHLVDASCSARAVARDDYPYPDGIELELTEDALALHDAYAEEQNESEFPVRVVLGEGAAIEGRAHFRGQTSLDCARKNYSVNLKGDELRRLMPGAADDEFYLISMCKEAYYFRQVLASEMMRALGLFPLDQRYVRLRVGGRALGVYLLLEKPHEALRADQAALSAVVRRRLDADDIDPESKYPDPDDAPADAAAALDSYLALDATIDTVAPDELYAALSASLDFDNYLRWMAVNTYLQCGDYVDETFFYASPELGAPGSGLYFRNHGWDADDLFKTCHHDGGFAHPDPHDIVYCAEGNLDRSLFVSDDVYARFVAELQALIAQTFPPGEVSALLRDVRDALFALLQDDEVCAAMGELVAAYPEAASCAQMRPIIEESMAEFEQLVRDRAALLQAKIDALGATQ